MKPKTRLKKQMTKRQMWIYIKQKKYLACRDGENIFEAYGRAVVEMFYKLNLEYQESINSTGEINAKV